MPIVDSKNYPAARPTRWTLFVRSFLPWQLVRFIIVNIKMTFMIVKSHGGRNNTVQEKEGRK
ncbi:MAG: hypothetical protein ACXVCP_07600 [Bdellovibrio sp.]